MVSISWRLTSLAAPVALLPLERGSNQSSNPSQSRPSTTGTGRSLAMPTSIGHVPGAAVMATRRLATCSLVDLYPPAVTCRILPSGAPFSQALSDFPAR